MRLIARSCRLTRADPRPARARAGAGGDPVGSGLDAPATPGQAIASLPRVGRGAGRNSRTPCTRRAYPGRAAGIDPLPASLEPAAAPAGARRRRARPGASLVSAARRHGTTARGLRRSGLELEARDAERLVRLGDASTDRVGVGHHQYIRASVSPGLGGVWGTSAREDGALLQTMDPSPNRSPPSPPRPRGFRLFRRDGDRPPPRPRPSAAARRTHPPRLVEGKSAREVKLIGAGEDGCGGAGRWPGWPGVPNQRREGHISAAQYSRGR